MAKKQKKKIYLSQNDTNQLCELSLHDAVNNFLLHCKARGLSDATIRNYRTSSKYFIEFIGNINLYDVTDNDIKNWLVHLQEKGTKQNTRRTYLKSLKIFLNHYNINLNVGSIGEQKVQKDIFTDEEIKRLLTKPKRKTFTSVRDYTIVCFLLATGVRAKTLVNIKIKDIDMHTNTIFLSVTKTNKQYHIPMSNALKQVIRDWLKVYPFASDESAYLFTTHWGDQMSCNTLKAMIQHYNRDHNVTGRGTHKYRRTFATNYARTGSVLVLQQLLGHNNVSTTQRYVTTSIDDLQKDFSDKNVLDISIKKAVKLNI